MTRLGPSRLTLAEVAKDAGISPAALVQRFGSKRGLLLAAAADAAGGHDYIFPGLRARHRSPVAALLGMAECMTLMGRHARSHRQHAGLPANRPHRSRLPPPRAGGVARHSRRAARARRRCDQGGRAPPVRCRPAGVGAAGDDERIDPELGRPPGRGRGGLDSPGRQNGARRLSEASHAILLITPVASLESLIANPRIRQSLIQDSRIQGLVMRDSLYTERAYI